MQIESTSGPRSKPLGIFTLAMMNVIAVDSLRSLPAGAEFSYSLVFYYLLAALCFFIPTALISAELATAWPTTGGVYIWVRTAFGQRCGFLTIWLQWVYNVIWYPTILSFIAATMAYLIDPNLVNHKFFMLSVVLGTLWLVTGLNCLGLRVTSWFISLGAIVGTLIPMIVITLLGIFWLHLGKTTEVQFTWAQFLPDFKNYNYHNLTFMTTIIFGLMGLEMSAVHAGDVRNPKRDYPRALLLSATLILGTLIFASLAIAIVIPPNKLSVLSGLTDAYILFFKNYGLTGWIPVMITLIILGSCCGVSAWLLGPTRGLMIAAKESGIKSAWLKVNKHNLPGRLLILQAIIVTFISSVFILMPSVSGAYWLLSVMTAQLGVSFYIFMFVAAIRLHHTESDTPRAFRIPGGKFGIWLCAILGIASCVFTFVVGFIPPPGIEIGSLLRFEVLLIGGIILFCLPPFLLSRWQRKKL